MAHREMDQSQLRRLNHELMYTGRNSRDAKESTVWKKEAKAISSAVPAKLHPRPTSLTCFKWCSIYS